MRERTSKSDREWYRNWRKNTVLAVESAIVIDWVETVECNVRGHDEGKINTHTYCSKVW